MRYHKTEKGRYSWYLGKDWQWGDPVIRLEFSRTYNFGLGFKISRGEEKDLQFSIHCWKLFSIWFTYEGKPFRYRGMDDVTILGFRWLTDQHVLQLQVMDHREMDSSKPAILSTYWNYRDWLFGRSIHSESSHGQDWHKKHVKIQLPEGEYDLAMDFYTSYWHRPRSPFVRSIERVEITPDRPVGIPGKGENSWDLDEDATFSSTQPVKGRTLEQIAEDFKQDILETRGRRASKEWIPEKKWAHVHSS